MNIIQIGCHNGDDGVLDFIKNHLSEINRVILIDANPNVIQFCKQTYQQITNNIEIINFAVVADDHSSTNIDFYVPKHDVCSQHCSCNPDHLQQHNHSEYDKISVPTISIFNLCKKYNMQYLDYLFVDTEGLDVSIIDSILLNSININQIKFEHKHSDGTFSNGGNKYDQLVQKLQALNYSVSKDGDDTIAIKIQNNEKIIK